MKPIPASLAVSFPEPCAVSTQGLPADDRQRELLHNEVHARPSARIRMPALIVFVAVLNDGVSREQECEHLRRLPGLADLSLERLNDNFVRLLFETHTLKWERHTEFTRYSIVQTLPEGASLDTVADDCLDASQVLPAGWLRDIPGRTVAAIQLLMLHADMPEATAAAQAALMGPAQQWFDGRTVVASQLGGGHSWAITDFQLRRSGFERMLVLAPPDTTDSRAGRISQRLLELETYRLMALRGLPVAKTLSPMLADAETQLAAITAQLENKSSSEQALLDQLVSLAARVERAIAENSYRFSATRAYDTLVKQRIGELREKPIPGTQTIGEFMQRRLSPAIATVAATSQRLTSLSERVARTSALLRTRVDIVTETQNQQLLEKLTKGQALQLRLQSTVEGLSIAAISYYVISLLLYGAKAMKASGLPVEPEVLVGVLIPVVLWAVWRTIRRIHDTLKEPD